MAKRLTGTRTATPSGRGAQESRSARAINANRRGLLRVAALAMVGAGITAAARSGAEAAPTNIQSETSNFAAAPTSIVNLQDDAPGVYAFGASDGGIASNTLPHSASLAGHNKNSRDAAILGYAEEGVGVYGYAEKGNAVLGDIQNSANDSAAVYGYTAGSGPGMYGESVSGPGAWAYVGAPNQSPALRATSEGTGAGLLAEVIPNMSGAAAVRANTKGRGPGILSESALGRGGVFAGAAAQLKLKPSTASTHPPRGQRGDLFVDKSGRLWFCSGGGEWTRLA